MNVKQKPIEFYFSFSELEVNMKTAKTSVKIPRKYQECEAEGEYWAVGFIAKKMSKVNPNLGAYAHNATREHAVSKYANIINRGGITMPTKSFLRDFKKMRKMFNDHHPTESLKRGPGLISNFFEVLKKKFAEYHKKVLHLVARLLTRFRIRAMNRKEKELRKKKRKAKGANTMRGRKKTVELSM